MPDQAASVTPRPAAARPAPPRYKVALLTWVGAYGVITLILGVLGPSIQDWPLAFRTLLISVLMVTTLTWVIVPTLVRLFRPWLAPAPPAAPTTSCGTRRRANAHPVARAQRRSAAG
jgi:uncharacterized protein